MLIVIMIIIVITSFHLFARSGRVAIIVVGVRSVIVIIIVVKIKVGLYKVIKSLRCFHTFLENE